MSAAGTESGAVTAPGLALLIPPDFVRVALVTQAAGENNIVFDALNQVYERAVHLKAPVGESEAGRQAIRKSVATTVRKALKRRYGGTSPVTVRVTQEVPGAVDSHVFDVVLSNGNARSILVTPNLRDPRTTEVRRDLDAAAWSIQDVSKRSPEIRFGLVRDPSARPVLLGHVDALVTSLPIETVERERLPQWAEEAGTVG